MSKTVKEERRKLAEDHWKYSEGLIIATIKSLNDELPIPSLSLLKYTYIESFLHGFKHGTEDKVSFFNKR